MEVLWMAMDENSTDEEPEVKSKEYKQCDNCKTTKRKTYEVKSIENGYVENLCYHCRFNRYFGITLQDIIDDPDGFVVAQEIFQLVRYGNYLSPYSQFANNIYFAYIHDEIKDGGIMKAFFEEKKHFSFSPEKRDEIIENLKKAHIIESEDEQNYYFTSQFLSLLSRYKDDSNELFSRILGLCLVNIIAFSKYDSTMKQIWLHALLKNLIDKSKVMADEDRLVEEVTRYECMECRAPYNTKDEIVAHLKKSPEERGHNINLPVPDQYERFIDPIVEVVGYKLYLTELEESIRKRMSPAAFMKFFSDGMNAHFYFYSKDGKEVLKEDPNGDKYFVVKAPWVRIVCKTLEKVKEKVKELEVTEGTEG